MKVMFRPLCALLFVFSSIGLSSCNPQKGEKEADERRGHPVKTSILRTASAASKVVKSGTLEANKDVMLTAQVPGRIQEVAAVLGAPCQKGETLVRLETDTYRIALEEARAAIRGAEAARDQARKTRQRLQRLEKRSGVTPQQIDEAELAVASASAAYERARAGFAAAKRNLDETKISCPFDGFVADVMVEQGQSLSPQIPVARVVDLSSLELRVAVTPAQLASLAEGDTVLLSDPLQPKVKERGNIARLGVAADPLTRLFPVEIVVEKPTGALKVGQVVDAQLELGLFEKGVLIPADAVSGEGDRAHAWVVEKGHVAKRRLGLGPRIADDFIVESGLFAGEEIVVVGAHGLEEGEPVDVVARIGADGPTSVVAEKSSGTETSSE